ncbi:MAG TPA: hypothetical protein VH062_32355 [Polyangiaceae bacterium]|jgi:hypothetical protein|nr:hypothetical protein [Polyangiaceae bacterium]
MLHESSLSVLAGPDALAELRDGGLSPARVRVLVGASGGAKWLVLRGLDRVLFPWLLNGARAPVHAVASSIGTWRFAALCTADPLAALQRFETAYVDEQSYAGEPTAADVSAEGARILRALLGEGGVGPLVEHPLVRLHVVAARFRHMGALEGRAQLAGLALAFALNAVARPALSGAIERVVFDAAGDPGPFAPWRQLPTRHVTLTRENAFAALSASAAIPTVMSGVRDPSGAPPGMYRDGGIADYHFGTEIDPVDGLALYPHFYPHLVPGWFDKSFASRRTRGLRRVVVLAPSDAFVASLPRGKIPDRKDFRALRDDERRTAWRQVMTRSNELGEIFAELVDSGRIGQVAKPL